MTQRDPAKIPAVKPLDNETAENKELRSLEVPEATSPDAKLLEKLNKNIEAQLDNLTLVKPNK